ncbi:FHA domain-containing protein [Streptomyces physcomitrii]|uniref:FHA domain-containing protein n=1 Tax=Streptomyces physcomitrii TaxID=2724184 RepID=UPI001FE7A38C|nr:FHA domain-containing protein [Streptomyces physcomitrii]
MRSTGGTQGAGHVPGSGPPRGTGAGGGGRAPGAGRLLPATHGSLARGASAPLPGTLFALALTGGMTLGPGEGREVLFGRNRPEVHVCLGEDDAQVSRHQGTLTHRDGRWWVGNVGRLPLRLAESRLLFRHEEPLPLGTGYTPLFIGGTRGREHLMEVFVTGPETERPGPRHTEVTRPPRVWVLTEQERLALVVLGRRYLAHDPRPQPLTWRQTAAELAAVQPGEGWTDKRVEHLVNGVRVRLSRDGVPWLTREEVGEPVGNALNDHLLRALLASTTLVPMDLALIDAA